MPLCARAGEGRAREVLEAVEHEVARLPAREELRVEPVQALDLEEPVAEENHAARGMPGEPLGLMDDPREGREVERNLVYASVAKELDRPYEEELGQAIGSRALTSHRRERHRRPAVRRRKLQERAHDARRVACDHDDRVTLLVRAELVERHGEAAFRFA